jgi:hypothetical protein
MSASASIKVVKSITYRGVVRSWSNRYHFSNDQPSTAAQWLTFSDAVVNAEKNCTSVYCVITGTFGYAAGSDVPVYQKVYTTAGLLALGTGLRTPGDVAGLVRYSTAKRTTKNHPLYLFNYYHGVYSETTNAQDAWATASVTAFNTYGTAWVTGFSDGVAVHKRAGPQGDIATGVYVAPYLTHRDFPRG